MEVAHCNRKSTVARGDGCGGQRAMHSDDRKQRSETRILPEHFSDVCLAAAAAKIEEYWND